MNEDLKIGQTGVLEKWEAITSEQKIERLRDVLMGNRYLIERISRLEKDVQRLKRHSHNENGVVIALTELNNDNSFGVGTYNPLT